MRYTNAYTSAWVNHIDHHNDATCSCATKPTQNQPLKLVQKLEHSKLMVHSKSTSKTHFQNLVISSSCLKPYIIYKRRSYVYRMTLNARIVHLIVDTLNMILVVAVTSVNNFFLNGYWDFPYQWYEYMVVHESTLMWVKRKERAHKISSKEGITWISFDSQNPTNSQGVLGLVLVEWVAFICREWCGAPYH